MIENLFYSHFLDLRKIEMHTLYVKHETDTCFATPITSNLFLKLFSNVILVFEFDWYYIFAKLNFSANRLIDIQYDTPSFNWKLKKCIFCEIYTHFWNHLK